MTIKKIKCIELYNSCNNKIKYMINLDLKHYTLYLNVDKSYESFGLKYTLIRTSLLRSQ